MEPISLEQSATVNELLEACIQAFGWSTHLTTLLSHSHVMISLWWNFLQLSCALILDESGTLKDASHVRMFLMMHPWYIPSTNMAEKLVQKYPECCSSNLFLYALLRVESDMDSPDLLFYHWIMVFMVVVWLCKSLQISPEMLHLDSFGLDLKRRAAPPSAGQRYATSWSNYDIQAFLSVVVCEACATPI